MPPPVLFFSFSFFWFFFFFLFESQAGSTRLGKVGGWLERVGGGLARCSVAVNVRAALPDFFLPATCEFREKQSSLLVCRAGILSILTDSGDSDSTGGTAAGETGGVTVSLDGLCVIACRRVDDWRSELELAEQRTAADPGLLLLMPITVSSVIVSTKEEENAWTQFKAPVAVRQVHDAACCIPHSRIGLQGGIGQLSQI